MGFEPDSLAAWLEEHPPAPDRFKASLAGMPGRVGRLNDAVKGFLAGEDPGATVVLDVPGLRCFAAHAALKVLAHRVGEET